jgi:glycosyltransferase involved in cell wall biosynthesis
MLIDSLYPGGAERVLVGLATNLPPERYEVTVCSTRPHTGVLRDELHAAGVRYVPLERKRMIDLGAFRRLLKLLREERFDVLHSHKFGSNVWGSIFGRLARTPVVVVHEHSWAYQGQPLRRFLDGKVIGRLADRMIAVSTRDQERMTSVEGVPPRKTVYIPNAFMPPAGDPPVGDLRAELGLGPDTPVVGTLAVLRKEKALDVLIEAFAIASKRVPDAHLVIGGYGPMQEPWEARARELGVSDRVHWLGMRRDGPVVMRGLDVAVMSSEREGMPLFAFEAMASRTPFVATDVGGLRDIFENGTSALLVEPGDAAALGGAIERLLLDPELRSSMAGVAHERLDEFSIGRAVERVTGLYESLLAKPRSDR